MKLLLALLLSASLLSAVFIPVTQAQQILTRDMLSKADYVVGRRAFQMRCGACHTLSDGVVDEDTAARRTVTHGDHPLGLGHLVI